MNRGFTLGLRSVDTYAELFVENVSRKGYEMFQHVVSRIIKKRFDLRINGKKKKSTQHIIIIIWDFLDEAKDYSGKSDAIKGKNFNLLSN